MNTEQNSEYTVPDSELQDTSTTDNTPDTENAILEQEHNSQLNNSEEQSNTETVADKAADSSAFDPQKYPIKYRGSIVYPKDQKHLNTLIHQGFGAAQTIEQYKKLQSELDARAKQYGRYEEFETALDNNPALKSKFEQFLESIKNGDEQISQPLEQGNDSVVSDSSSAANPEIAYLKNEIATLKNTLKQYQPSIENLAVKEADAGIEKESLALKEKFKDLGIKWDEKDDGGLSVMEYVYKTQLDAMKKGRPFDSLEDAFKSFYFDNLSATIAAETKKKMAEEQQRNAKAGIVQNGKISGDALKAAPNIRSMNYNQLAEQALSEMSA